MANEEKIEPMANEKKIESLKFMSQTHRGLFDERRRYEMKMFFTGLTFYVLAGAYSVKGDMPDNFVESCEEKTIIWAAFLILAVFFIMFLRAIHIANFKNKDVAELSEEAIIGLINSGEKMEAIINPFKNIDKKDTSKKWINFLLEAVIICLFAIGSAMIITNS